MAVKLDKMSLDELKTLQRDVTKAIGDYETRKKREALAAAESAVKVMGFSLAELLGTKPSKNQGRKKGDAKYAHPDNPELTWSGRGRQPAWIKELEAAGRNRQEFAI